MLLIYLAEKTLGTVAVSLISTDLEMRIKLLQIGMFLWAG